MIEPSGTCYQYYGCASGRGKQIARNEIEKQNFREQTVEEVLPHVAKILLKCQEEMKDKKQELEISVVTGGTHRVIARDVIEALTSKALEEIENEQMEVA